MHLMVSANFPHCNQASQHSNHKQNHCQNDGPSDTNNSF